MRRRAAALQRRRDERAPLGPLGAGVVCAPSDGRRLAEAVLRLFRASPQERMEMGRRARAYYERHFERNMLLDRLEALLREVVRRRGAAGG